MRLKLPGIFFLLITLFVGVFLITQPASSQNFIEPGEDPPGGAIAPPFNASNSGQFKNGSLVIGDGGDRFCLNADATLGGTLDQIAAADTTNCISAWSDVTNSLTSRFLLRLQAGTTGDQTQPANYIHQFGYARIQSTGTNQAYSLIATAPAYCVEQSMGAIQQCGTDPDQQPCYCINGSGSCSNNTDCEVAGAPGVPASTVGLYATDGGQSNNDAGLFGGRFYIYGGISHYGGNHFGRLCLNGTTGIDCISSWDQAEGNIFPLVKLQTYALGAGVSPSEKQLGSAAITQSILDVNGLSHSSAILAGDPNDPTIGGLNCGSRPCACGDGYCATSYENATSCPVDCQQINPTLTVYLSPNFGTVGVATTYNGMSNPGHLLVTRSTNPNSSFVPQSGRIYQANTTIGDSIIIGTANTTGTSGTVNISDTTATTGIVYYYRVFPANQFPRYASPKVQSAEFVALTVTFKGSSSAGGFGGQLNSFFCNSTLACTNRTVLEVKNSTETLDVVLASGYTFSYSGACTGGGICTILMDGPKTLTGTFTSGGGGGPGGGGLGGGGLTP